VVFEARREKAAAAKAENESHDTGKNKGKE
jgi:hypothetical protein